MKPADYLIDIRDLRRKARRLPWKFRRSARVGGFIALAEQLVVRYLEAFPDAKFLAEMLRDLETSEPDCYHVKTWYSGTNCWSGLLNIQICLENRHVGGVRYGNTEVSPTGGTYCSYEDALIALNTVLSCNAAASLLGCPTT